MSGFKGLRISNTGITCPENLNCCFVVPQSNLFHPVEIPKQEFQSWIVNDVYASAPTISLKLLWILYYVNKCQCQKFQYEYQQMFLLDATVFKQ